MTTSEDRSASAASSSEAAPSNETPKAESAPEAPAVIALPMIKPLHDESAQAGEPARTRLRRHAPLAAGIALAAGLGALAGAAATAGLLRDDAPPAAFAAADATRTLQDGMLRLETELATLKAGIGASQRSAGTQFAKLAERLERAEKAQAEPTAKIAKIAESLDRVERRLPPQAAAHPEVTGSVAAKQDSKPPLAEGWRLLDVYGGRAVVESRAGRVFVVGPGSNLPGLGQVEGIKREDGKVIVVTRNGIIAGSLERRRAPYPLPYRY
jgi:hypothetical protein